jgi:hypothetical protein
VKSIGKEVISEMMMFLVAIGFEFIYLSKRNQKINEIGKPDNK